MGIESIEDAFQRGHNQGMIMARLDGHDAKFAAINGSIGRFAAESANLTSAVQEMRNDLKGRDETASALIAADTKRRTDLEAADDERATKAERKFIPVTRALGIIAAVEGLLLTWLTWQQASGKA